jgi:hypothetical protein
MPGIGEPLSGGSGSSGSSGGWFQPQGSPGGSGGSWGGGSGGQSSGVDWSSFAQQIPAEYRNDPSQFINTFNENRRYRDFYEKEYTPWRSQFDEKSWTDYHNWRQGQGQQGQQSQEIDWEDYAAPRKAYEQLNQSYTKATQRIEALERNLEEKAAQVLQLMSLVREVDQLTREHGLSGQEIVEFAMNEGISPSQAAQRLRQESVKQRASTSPLSARQATRGYSQRLQQAGGLHNVVSQRFPELPRF